LRCHEKTTNRGNCEEGGNQVKGGLGGGEGTGFPCSGGGEKKKGERQRGREPLPEQRMGDLPIKDWEVFVRSERGEKKNRPSTPQHNGWSDPRNMKN